MRNLRWPATILAIVAILGMVGLSFTQASASRKNNAPPVGQCVRYDTTHAYACVQGGVPHDGLMYVWDGLYLREFYWHPATGDAAVGETYTCFTNDARNAYGHMSCSQAFAGATYQPRYDRRTVTIAATAGLPNGCVVTGYNMYPSTNPFPDITTCHPMNGTGEFPAPPVAVKSFRDFWTLMQLVPGEW